MCTNGPDSASLLCSLQVPSYALHPSRDRRPRDGWTHLQAFLALDWTLRPVAEPDRARTLRCPQRLNMAQTLVSGDRTSSP